jgi:DNA processing protein
MNSQDTASLASFLHLGISKKSLQKLLKQYGSFFTVWNENISAYQHLLEESDREKIELKDEGMLAINLKKCEQESIQAISHEDESYPLLLKEISASPAFLFVRGDLSLLSAVQPIAVVGTRMISDYGKQVLYEMIPSLVRAGATIVSGLAYGVDSLAHEIALEHGGKCVAVLGSGVDIIYPAAHRTLSRKILEQGGAIVSELPLGMQPLPQFFPARNRIISGLSKATLVIEAKEQSGSLITAQFALDQNRDVYAVPGNIFSENQQGTNLLISQGAYPLLSVDSLLTQLHLKNGDVEKPATSLTFDTPEEKLIYESLQEPRSLDELHQLKGLEISKISQLLSLMELKGFVRSLGQRYVRG